MVLSGWLFVGLAGFAFCVAICSMTFGGPWLAMAGHGPNNDSWPLAACGGPWAGRGPNSLGL